MINFSTFDEDNIKNKPFIVKKLLMSQTYRLLLNLYLLIIN
jgi:hypothetical protein